MSGDDWLAGLFEEHRPRLRAVAYRMLGSVAEADDVVQEAWVRLSRSSDGSIDNLGAWLTTVVGRLCLDMLRSRKARREEPLGVRLPEVVITMDDAPGPEDEALMAESVGLALQVVLDTLAPAERLAFVLHDMFDLPFEEIAPMVGRSPDAARQLASRARRRVRGTAPVPDPDLSRQRQVVDAFFTAARGGDFEALAAVLAPEVVLRADPGGDRPVVVVHGPEAVGARAASFASPGRVVHNALVNGAAGVVITVSGQPVSIMAFTVTDGQITEIDAITDPGRLAGLQRYFPGQ
jgi:RNA polymerase sigma-70 factor, ECF subfamily